MLLLLAVTIAGQAAACPAVRLGELGDRMLEDSLALRFGEARQRVPAFGTWAYDWAQSYLTSYRIIGQALSRAGEAAAPGGALPNAEALAHSLAEPIRTAFRQRVTGPSLGNGGFPADMAHLARSLAAEWPQPAERAALEARLREALDIDLGALLADGSGAETVFLRSLRPMAARIGALTLRVTEAGSVVAAVGYLGYSLAGAPGVVAGAAGGIGLAWGADWLINRIDAGLNRSTFEAQALEAIGAAEAAGRAAAQAALRGAIRAACP